MKHVQEDGLVIWVVFIRSIRRENVLIVRPTSPWGGGEGEIFHVLSEIIF